MTVELSADRIYRELSSLHQEVQVLRDRLDALAPAARPTLRSEHPHIVRAERVRGGRPMIRGAGVTVQTIIEQTRLGRSPAQIIDDFDGVLTLAQVHDALSYFYEHQGEIEQDIVRSRAALHRGPQKVDPA